VDTVFNIRFRDTLVGTECLARRAAELRLCVCVWGGVSPCSFPLTITSQQVLPPVTENKAP